MNIWIRYTELREKFPVGEKVRVLRTALSPDFLKKLGNKELTGFILDYLWDSDDLSIIVPLDIDCECNTASQQELWFFYEDQIELCRP